MSIIVTFSFGFQLFPAFKETRLLLTKLISEQETQYIARTKVPRQLAWATFTQWVTYFTLSSVTEGFEMCSDYKYFKEPLKFPQILTKWNWATDNLQETFCKKQLFDN